MASAQAAFARAHRGAEGTAVILSANPIHDTGGGQRSAQLALELLQRGWAVAFVSHGVVTETVDLGLRYEQPRLVRWTMQEALRPDARRSLLEALEEGSGLVITQVPVREWIPWVREATERGAPTVYDCIDRWDSELGRGWYRRDVEAEVARASTTLVASAPVLVDHVEELTGRRVELVPNAFNGRIFDAGLRAGLPRPATFPEEGRVALYVGALWGGWLDWDLVRSAAEALPGTTFVFVGDRRGEGRRLPGNCTFTGLLPQTELPPYLAHADVAFLPWHADDVTAATSPLKVYEFVAMELPVIAPAIEPLRGIPGVWTEGSPEAFVRALGSVERRGLGDEKLGEMRAFALDNSWARRVDDLLSLAGDGFRAEGKGGHADARSSLATEASAGRSCISVVVPAYNHERFIGRALESVQRQTLPPGEVMVVDDGSPDETAEVVEGFVGNGVRLVRQENRGAHNALNRAIRLSRGDWIAVLNSDDAWEPERLEHAWAVSRETGAALVLGSVRLVDDDGSAVDPTHEIARWYREARSWAEEAGSLRAVMARHNIGVTTSNFFFHRSLWRRLEGFRDYRYVHDYDFIARAMELCPGGVVYEPELGGVLYRVHAANTITDGGAAQRERKALMTSLARPVGRLRRMVSAWRGRRPLVQEVEASSILEPVGGPNIESRNVAPARGGAVGGRPRVGLVVDALGLGGLEEVVALLAQALPTAGVDTAVVCVGKVGDVARRLIDAGVDVSVLGGRVGQLGAWASEKGIVAANSHFAPVEAVEALAESGVPVVETVQNCYAWLDDEGWSAERRRADSVAGVIAVSETVGAYYARRTGRASDWTVPNAVHPARAAAAPRAFARQVLGLPE
ncbi:MAG: glycosyltransferase, partial [Gemmatimonadetes bacterium]|nr:glycosyltransferase [Gemmatimonadota bacterium]